MHTCGESPLQKIMPHAQRSAVQYGTTPKGRPMLKDREKVLSALQEKPMKIFEVMKRANMTNQEACQSLLLKMRDEGSIKFDINKGIWSVKT
jgi:predicted transcriptional regulator